MSQRVAGVPPVVATGIASLLTQQRHFLQADRATHETGSAELLLRFHN
ncbi:hypothetical protein [Dendronalium sp. ChiSLP03b]|nr:hypothetical protein [Dendronalium sp. ChiSLP03b]MDZ8202956.1 hypothetical protein [Dendronalium sp. ChiSLP03b]